MEVALVVRINYHKGYVGSVHKLRVPKTWHVRCAAISWIAMATMGIHACVAGTEASGTKKK
eukprot:291280-Amphidinium_carterae.1